MKLTVYSLPEFKTKAKVFYIYCKDILMREAKLLSKQEINLLINCYIFAMVNCTYIILLT